MTVYVLVSLCLISVHYVIGHICAIGAAAQGNTGKRAIHQAQSKRGSSSHCVADSVSVIICAAVDVLSSYSHAYVYVERTLFLSSW